jgi:hypothetical protein
MMTESYFHFLDRNYFSILGNITEIE